ncbi:MAG: penicillin-binding protein 1C [Anaerolineae bacterium]
MRPRGTYDYSGTYRQSAGQPVRRAGAPPMETPGCLPRLLQGFFTAFLVTFALGALALAVALFGYVYIALQLPPAEELTSRVASFVSTRIYDRNGVLLYEIDDPHGGRRTLVKLSEISPYLIQATIATEDANFYQHPGVDPVGLARAIYRAVQEREATIGGSTIPQQLVKLVFLSPERTIRRKIKEAVLAAEISRRYSKDEILAIYLNEIYYGNRAYGIEAAAEVYFGKRASDLTLAEAALLAGIPQAPAVYDPFANPKATRERRSQVLRLMVKNGYITEAEAQAAEAEPLPTARMPLDLKAPHFVMYVRQQLEQRYGPEVLYKAGLQVTTTLDYSLQVIAEEQVRQHVLALGDRHVTNGALVAIRPATGEVLAMVGSRGFFDPDIDGQVNVAVRPRQPGSAIKPLTYLAAFERGWTPATLIWDVETEFPDGANPPYKPVNYDGKFHGPVLVRQALGNSYNVPAVKALQFVGIPGLLDMARRLGITTLNRQDYGLSLTLGGGEVTLLELTSAYATLANGGVRVPPAVILRIEDAHGRVLESYSPAREQAVSPQHAYLITHILADNEARQPTFGPNSVLRLSRPAAVKTGTTNDFRDNWTVGYTPDLAVGVWVGNNDNTPMQNVSGVAGAGPIWHDFMERALTNMPARDFERPAGIVEIEICADSGTIPSEACPQRRMEIFAEGQGPLGPEHDFHQMVAIDVSTGQLATEFCPPELVERRPMEVYPPEALEWARANGRPIAPTEPCSVHTGPIHLEIFEPKDGHVLLGQVPIFGVVQVPGLAEFRLEYGEGPAPIGWGHVAGPFYQPVEGGMLAIWDTTALKDMDYSLRVIARDTAGHTYEARVHVWVQNNQAEETPTPTPTPLPTGEPSPTPSPILEPTPIVQGLAAELRWPAERSVVGGLLSVQGSAAGEGLADFRLDYGVGEQPAEWLTLVESEVPVPAGVLAQWDTTTVPDGLYTLRLQVFGREGAVTEVRVRCYVDNTPPAARILLPASDQTIPAGQPLTVQVEVFDNLGIERVEIIVDGQPATVLTSAPFEWTWDAPTSGTHQLQATAYDLAGHSAVSEPITLTIGG